MEKKPDPIKLHYDVKEYFEKIYKKYDDCEELTIEEKVIIVLTAQQKQILDAHKNLLEDILSKLEKSCESNLQIIEKLDAKKEYLEEVVNYFDNVEVDETLN
jgi:hypothetical protein